MIVPLLSTCASVHVDDTVYKVGKYVSSGHSNDEAVSCFRCGGNHSASGSWARSVQCYKFHTKVHPAKTCDTERDGAIRALFGGWFTHEYY